MAKVNTKGSASQALAIAETSAKTTLKVGVQTAEVTENYIQGLYRAGYDTNVQALKVSKNYWNATTEIRKDWLKLFADTAEGIIDATAKYELPSQKEIADFGKGIYNGASDLVGSYIPQAKSAK